MYVHDSFFPPNKRSTLQRAYNSTSGILGGTTNIHDRPGPFQSLPDSRMHEPHACEFDTHIPDWDVCANTSAGARPPAPNPEVPTILLPEGRRLGFGEDSGQQAMRIASMHGGSLELGRHFPDMCAELKGRPQAHDFTLTAEDENLLQGLVQVGLSQLMSLFHVLVRC